MKFAQALEQKGIPQLMKDILRIVPVNLWRHRVDSLNRQEKAHVFLGPYFNREFKIERCFEEVSQYHRVTGRYPKVNVDNY